jgi:hypothetical protein
MEKFAVTHLVKGESWSDRQLDSSGTEEREILKDKRDSIWAGPKGVLDASVFSTMVVAPFAFAEAVISAEEDPIAQCGVQTVGGALCGAGDDFAHHGVMDHLPAVGDFFVLPNRIRHKGDIVQRHPGAR